MPANPNYKLIEELLGKTSKEKPVNGETFEAGNGIFTTGIDFHSWPYQIEVHGESKEQIEAMRDLIKHLLEVAPELVRAHRVQFPPADCSIYGWIRGSKEFIGGSKFIRLPEDVLPGDRPLYEKNDSAQPAPPGFQELTIHGKVLYTR